MFQTFHTPSFGDEVFDVVSPINHPSQMQHHQHMQPSHHHMDPHAYPMHQTNVSHQMTGLLDDQQNQYSLWHQESQQQHLYSNPHEYDLHQPTGNQMYYTDPLSNPQQQQQQQQQHHNTQSHQQMLMMPPPQKSPQVTSPMSYVGQSPHTYGENGTTSDDSDDSGLRNLKRPSPEPLGGSAEKMTPSSNAKSIKPTGAAAQIKKPKVQRKKKKKDPNEPQKPVSAYALFFRDTQAAIKGQNPNASFGEVSTIVASMWDVLAPEHKDVYKKKTEAAKIIYLKTLAAYRANVVSKGSDVELSPPIHQSPVPLQPQQPSPQINTAHVGAPLSAPQVSPPQQQQQQQHHSQQGLPMQQQSNQYIINQQQQSQQMHPSYSQQPQPYAYKSPEYNNMQSNVQTHQQQLQQMGMSNSNQMNSYGYEHSAQPLQPQISHNGLDNSMYNMNQPPQHNPMSSVQQHNQHNSHHLGVNSIVGSDSHHHQQQQAPPSQQQQQQQQQQHQQHHQQINQNLATTPAAAVSAAGMNTSPNSAYQPNVQSLQQCIRNGCTNQAMVSSDWEDEYCSNECVINHCGDVFGNWIQKNGQQQQSYSAVK